MQNGNKGRHAYLILAHNQIDLLNKLITLLDHPRNDIYVHIDSNSDIKKGDITERKTDGLLKIYKEIAIYWSDFSLTESELFLLRKAIDNGPYQYYHLLSGSDLPIKSQEYILNFFDKNNGREFVEYQVPGKFLSKPYYERIKYYHVLTKHYRSGKKVKDYFFVGLEYFCIFWQWLFRVNRIPRDMDFARGSQWFDITDDLARYILENEAWIKKQFRATRASDESFLPLLVHNNPKFKDALYFKTFDGDMHGNMRYIDWSRGDPHVIASKDVDMLLNSDFLFARKFSEKSDEKAIDKVFNALKKDNRA